MPRPLKLVSYVLVNWKTELWLPRALDSLAAQTHPLGEILLVNNASPSWDPAVLADRELRFIDLHENLGFAAGNNVGIEAARGDVVVLLNCDAWLDRGFTARAIEVLEANPRIGSVVPKILRGDDSGIIDSAGHVMRTDRSCFNRGQGERDEGQYEAAGFVFGGQAAAIAYRRDMLEALSWRGQVFDESFFAYFEDVDLDWRAQLGGWLAYYEPRCKAWHMAAGSGGRRRQRIQRLAEKNRYLMLTKCDSLPAQIRHWPALLLYEAWHLLLTLLRPWVWLSLLDYIVALPGALAWRRGIQRNAVLAPVRVAATFRRRGDTRPLPSAPPAAEVGAGTAPASTGPPLVSAVVLNYNGLPLTRACLEALKAQTYEALEIIVVDNGSASDEAALLAMDSARSAAETGPAPSVPLVRTLRLERNLGFSGGVNWGVSLAGGAYIALVNNDCLPDSECIRKLVHALLRSGAAAVSGRLVNVHSGDEAALALRALDAEHEAPEDVVWDLPPGIQSALDDSHRHHGLSLFGYSVPDAYGKPGCFYPSGGLCCLRRETIVTFLPELLPQDYFAYHEDIALGYALHLRGLRVIKEPRAAAVHLESSTARKLGGLRLRYLQERNRWRNILRYYPAAVLLALWPLLALQSLGAFVALLFTSPAQALGLLGGQIWLSTHPFQLLAERRQARALQSGPDSTWLRELSCRTRGGPLADRLALAWCRLWRLPCRELDAIRPSAPA